MIKPKDPSKGKYEKILHLTLTRKWFDMILSGEKKEEYRDQKRYWATRLIESGKCPYYTFKDFDCILFRNGYAKDAPEMYVEFKGTTMDRGRKDWGAVEGEHYYVIKLGKVISTTNIK